MRCTTTRLVLLALLVAFLSVVVRAGPDEPGSSPEALGGFALDATFEPPEGWFVIRRPNGELRCTRKNEREESTVVETDDRHRIRHIQWFHPVRSDEDIDRVFARLHAEKEAFRAFLVHEDDDASDGEMEVRFQTETWKRRVHLKAPFFSIALYRIVPEEPKKQEEIVVLPRTLGGFTLGEAYAPSANTKEVETTALPGGTRRIVFTGGKLYVLLTPDGKVLEIGERFPFGNDAASRFEALKREHEKAELALDILRAPFYLLSFRDSVTALRVQGDANQEVTTLVDRALRARYPVPEPEEAPKAPLPVPPTESEPEPAADPGSAPPLAPHDLPAYLDAETALTSLCGHMPGEAFRAPADVSVQVTQRHGAKAHAYALGDGGRVVVGTDAAGTVIYVSLRYQGVTPALFASIAERQIALFGASKQVDHSQMRRDLLVRTIAFGEGAFDRSIDYRDGDPADLLVQVEPALPREAMGLTLGTAYEPTPGEGTENKSWGRVYSKTQEDGTVRRIGVDRENRIVLVGSKSPDPDGALYADVRRSLLAKHPFQADLRSDQITVSDGSTVVSVSSYRGLIARTLYDARTRYQALRVDR